MNPNQASPRIPVAQLREFDAICDRYERDWNSEKRPLLADYLGSFSEPGRSELLRQLLELEFELRRANGDTPQADEYVPRFPELSEWIEQHLQFAEQSDSNDTRENRPAKVGESNDGSDDEDPLLGRTLGKYTIVAKLGAGGMGAVYHARHSMIQCERALKLLHPNLSRDPEAVQRFLIEAQACVELTHRNIVTTYHVDQEDDGTVYLVMELLSGENLHQLVSRLGPLEIKQSARIVQQVAAGLNYAHQRGRVHRDVKPHNVMWTEDLVAKVLDLGLVRILEDDADPVIGVTSTIAERCDALLTRYQSRLTDRNALLGTLPYMSPEQAASARDADKQSDVYSLGCTFYYLLTGQHAFAGNSAEEIVRKHLEADFIPVAKHRADVPESLQEILTRMMSSQREARFASAADVDESLRAWLGDYGSRPAKSLVHVDLGNLPSLRNALVQLRVISEDDWKTAELEARRIQEKRAPNQFGHTTLFDPEQVADPSVLILQQLQSLQSSRGEQNYGLSEFQVRHVLNGNLDVLRLPHHVLLDQVGRGWKGEVFKARNLDADRIEVVRTFAPRLLDGLEGIGNERIRSFRTAVKKLAELDHPFLPRVYEGGSYENRLHGELTYCAAEFVRGNNVAEVVHNGRRPNGRPIDLAWTVTKIRDTCQALQYAHDAGVLHLDIHALSLKIDHADQVQLLDLGIARLLTEPYRERPLVFDTLSTARALPKRSRAVGWGAFDRATVPPPPVGTASVMPPEQWQNRQHASAATDIYNLGCTLFFMLTGQYPFEGHGALELMEKHRKVSPFKSRAATSIPKRLRPILATALAKSPPGRFPSAQAMGDALDEFLASDDSTENRTWIGFLTRKRKR